MTATPYPNFPNKAHQRAYTHGVEAADAGKDRAAPYDCGNRSSLHFRRAWLAGYDGRTDALRAQQQEPRHDR